MKTYHLEDFHRKAGLTDEMTDAIILGIRPDYDGLVVDPCLPDTMDGFTLSRLFRGTSYRITVRRGAEKGLVVDGKPVAGNTVPLTDAPVCYVELTV